MLVFNRRGFLVLKNTSPQRAQSNSDEVYIGTPKRVKFFRMYDKARLEDFKRARKMKKRPVSPFKREVSLCVRQT